ncbi:MAG: MoaD/ThiS family protein [Nitrospinota bacterium]
MGRVNVTFELYGTARLRAGLDTVEVRASRLGEALEILEERCPALEGDVLCHGRLQEHFRLSRNGRLFVSDPQQLLAEGDMLLILSAAAGG